MFIPSKILHSSWYFLTSFHSFELFNCKPHCAILIRKLVPLQLNSWVPRGEMAKLEICPRSQAYRRGGGGGERQFPTWNKPRYVWLSVSVVFGMQDFAIPGSSDFKSQLNQHCVVWGLTQSQCYNGRSIISQHEALLSNKLLGLWKLHLIFEPCNLPICLNLLQYFTASIAKLFYCV